MITERRQKMSVKTHTIVKCVGSDNEYLVFKGAAGTVAYIFRTPDILVGKPIELDRTAALNALRTDAEAVAALTAPQRGTPGPQLPLPAQKYITRRFDPFDVAFEYQLPETEAAARAYLSRDRALNPLELFAEIRGPDELFFVITLRTGADTEATFGMTGTVYRDGRDTTVRYFDCKHGRVTPTLGTSSFLLSHGNAWRGPAYFLENLTFMDADQAGDPRLQLMQNAHYLTWDQLLQPEQNQLTLAQQQWMQQLADLTVLLCVCDAPDGSSTPQPATAVFRARTPGRLELVTFSFDTSQRPVMHTRQISNRDISTSLEARVVLLSASDVLWFALEMEHNRTTLRVDFMRNWTPDTRMRRSIDLGHDVVADWRVARPKRGTYIVLLDYGTSVRLARFDLDAQDGHLPNLEPGDVLRVVKSTKHSLRSIEVALQSTPGARKSVQVLFSDGNGWVTTVNVYKQSPTFLIRSLSYDRT